MIFLTGNNLKISFTLYNRDNGTVKKYDTKSLFISNEINVLKKLEFNIISEDTLLTFIADILANSAYYYISKNMSENPMLKPNSEPAISGHPLSKLAYGTYNQI